KVRSRYSTTLHVEGEQPWIVLVDWIEQLCIFIPNITVGADPSASRAQREKSAFLAVADISTDPEVSPIEREPPIPLIRSTVSILCGLLWSVVFNIPVTEAVLCFREPALLVRKAQQPLLEFAPHSAVVVNDLVSSGGIGSRLQLVEQPV